MRDAFVICTLDRPADLAACLDSIAAQTVEAPICLVVDASVGDETRRLVERRPAVEYLHTEPGLTHQRNRGVAALDDGVDVVHFVDDDVVLDPGYVAAIRAEFEDPEVAGVGGVVTNAPTPRPHLARRLFFLDSRRPGRVLSSGRNILTTGVGEPSRVDWLSGCSMSYLMETLQRVPFDERLSGYCLGEDVDYAISLGPDAKIIATPAARLVHNSSPVNRYSVGRQVTAEVVARHRRVRRFPERFSRLAFWWSVAGELGLAMAIAVLGARRSALPRIPAILRGCLAIVRRNPTAT